MTASADRFTCVATSSFGLEAVVRAELEGLGIAVERVEDRRVLFPATAAELARCNIGLRTADRVLIEAASFPAPDFDALYEGVRAAPWRELCAPFPAVTVNARSVKSRLTAVPALQSVAKKAIVDALQGSPRVPRGHPAMHGGKRGVSPGAPSRGLPPQGVPRVPETGPHYDVELVLHADRASVCLDTTGQGLHKRGYRRQTGEAPLRENLAAALVLLSRWDPSRPFADPLCGSGTIPIEAAMIAARIAPGVARSFAAEEWPLIPARAWREARERARDEERRDTEVRISGSDRDAAVVEAASHNARSAGVAGMVRLCALPLSSFRAEGEYGCIVSNPPYGERLGDEAEAAELYRAMGELYRGLPTWSFFALSAREDFPRHFGSRASRNRKLYNGNIRCWYFQYFGPWARRDAARASV
jgi:putative N6-adenine-specific DNA methylase